MDVRTWWIPKSERGRQVARTLRERGYSVKNKEVIGHYVCNLPCANELTRQDLRAIAYDIDPEQACAAEDEACMFATKVRENPVTYTGERLSSDEAEEHAARIVQSWMIGGVRGPLKCKNRRGPTD